MSAGGTDAGGMSGSAGMAAGAGGSGGAAVCAPPTVNLTGADAVDGTLVQFNDNGGWCWYQDERVIVDPAGGQLIVGSVASGGTRNGNIEAVVHDIAAGQARQPERRRSQRTGDCAPTRRQVRRDVGGPSRRLQQLL